MVQDGFGWTNGVVIKFMEWFGKDLKATNECQSKNNSINNAILSKQLFFLVSIYYYLF